MTTPNFSNTGFIQILRGGAAIPNTPFPTQDEIQTFSHIYALCKCMKVTYNCDMRRLKLLKGDPYFTYIYPRLKGVFNDEISLFIFPGKFKYL